MSPAGPAEATPIAAPASLEGTLGEGETVILALKPSGWFVLMVAMPRLVFIVLAAVAMYLADRTWNLDMPPSLIGLVVLFAACLCVLVACLQWLGRLYVLTDRRILTVHGLRVPLIGQCPLTAVRQVFPSARLGERLIGIGTLWFRCDGERIMTWLHIHQPGEVAEIVSEAIRRAK